jgi:CheY-like chemotaxis protein
MRWWRRGRVREGIRAYRAAPTDLIITDIIMPGEEGMETIRALRQAFPAIIIVAMTGSRLFALDLLDMARLMGATRTLAKPQCWHPGEVLAWPELQEVVHELLAAP